MPIDGRLDGRSVCGDRRSKDLRKNSLRSIEFPGRPATRRRRRWRRPAQLCAPITSQLYDHLVNVRIREIDGPLYAATVHTHGVHVRARARARYRAGLSCGRFVPAVATLNGRSSRGRYSCIDNIIVHLLDALEFVRLSLGRSVCLKIIR